MATINDIAKVVSGEVLGDGSGQIMGMRAPAFAKEGDLTFAIDEQGFQDAAKSEASCVLSTVEIPDYPKTLLKVGDMKLSMTVLYNAMLEMAPPVKGSIHSSAVISESAIIGENVIIGSGVVVGERSQIGDNVVIQANCVIGAEVTIGKKSCLFPNVSVYDYMVIGNGVRIHAGAVIGADGFGYVPKDGKTYKVPQMGMVIIEDNVEIGANACIDRGTFENTVVAEGAKIDNLVMIAHNVKVGKNVFIAALSGVAGSSTIGDGSMLGGKVGVSDHVTVGKNVMAGGMTGIFRDVKEGSSIFDYPHRSAEDAKKLHGVLSILLKHQKRFRAFLRELPKE